MPKYNGDPSEWSGVQVDLVEQPDGTVEAVPVGEEQEASS